MKQTSESLLCKWMQFSRESQNVLATTAKVKSKKISGTTDEEIEGLAMEIYRNKAGKKDENGVSNMLLLLSV